MTCNECVNEWLGKCVPSDNSWLGISTKLMSSHNGRSDDQVKLNLCLHIFYTLYAFTIKHTGLDIIKCALCHL